jgi:hypothetical protein
MFPISPQRSGHYKLFQNEVDVPQNDGTQTEGFLMFHRSFVVHPQFSLAQPNFETPSRKPCSGSSMMTEAGRFLYVAYLTAIENKKYRMAINLARSSTEVARQAWRL